MDEHRTPGGIPAGSISGFIQAHQPRIVERFYAVPRAVTYIADPDAKYYTIMRLAIERDIGLIATANPSTTLRLAETAESQAERLIRDVHEGTLSGEIDVGGEIRESLSPRLRPNPELASRLDELAAKRGRLLPMDYWNVAALANWTGGTVGLYVNRLGDYFGPVPVRDLGLLASEARMNIPMSDATAGGPLEVTSNFYEFIPSDQVGAKTPDVLRCHELAEGEDYLILLTTGGGLFRYNIGDLVRCEGYMGQAPFVRFLNKGRHTSSITGEKLTEHQVVTAAERAAAALDISLGNFVLCPRWDRTPYYALNVEPGRLPAARWDELASALDRELLAANIEYEQKRHSGRLGEVRVAPVRPGFWDKLHEQHIRERRGRREQYKHQFLYTEVDADAAFKRPQVARPAAGRSTDS
jgi:hypothetical protein